MRLWHRLTLMTTFLFGTSGIADDALRFVRVPHVESTPLVDGQLTDPVWNGASRLTDFRRAGSVVAAAAATEAFIAAGDRFLFVAVRCHDAHLDDLVRRVAERDGAVTADDSVEVFVDPGTEGEVYFHFMLSVGNVQADQISTTTGRDRSWDTAWQSATACDPLLPEAGWTAELALPLSPFRERAGAAEWRINVCRNKRTDPSESTSWAAMRRGFHSPTSFGFALGLTGVSAPDRFVPTLLSAEAVRYRLNVGLCQYEVRLEVVNDGNRAGTVILTVEDRPSGGRSSSSSVNVPLGSGERRRVVVPVSISAPGEREATAVLMDSASGQAAQRMPVARLANLDPLRAWTDRTYYTTEETARIVLDIRLTADELRVAGLQARVRVQDARRHGVFESCSPVIVPRLSVPVVLRQKEPAEYAVEVTIEDRDGNSFGKRGLTLVKRLPAPADVRETKIDQQNRALLVDGQPFFPVGICAKDFAPHMLAFYRDLGFNTIVRWGWGAGSNHPIEDALATLDAAHGLGLRVIESPLSFLRTRVGSRPLRTREGMRTARREVPAFLQTVSCHPAVIAHYGLDEASAHALGDELSAFLDTVHRHDPYHPLYISGSSVSRLSDYTVADIIGRHAYWCRLGLPTGGRPLPNVVVQSVQWAFENASEPNGRPLFFMPQAEMTSASRRPHTPRERRVTVYLAVIHGAKSILYWVAPIRHVATAASMRELSGELHALAPALLRRSPPQEIEVAPSPPDGLPVLHAALKAHPAGHYLLIAANASPAPVTITWDIGKLGSDASVSDFLGQADISSDNGVFSDRFAGFGTRVYCIADVVPPAGSRLQVRAKLSGEAVANLQPAASASSPRTVNLLSNPGFEQGTDGWQTFAGGGAEASVDRTERGTARFRIFKPDLRSTGAIYYGLSAVRAGRTYRYGGRIRARLATGTSAGFFRLYAEAPSGTPKAFSSGVPIPSVPADVWSTVEREVSVPPGSAAKAIFCFQFSSQACGEVLLDDLFVEELASVPAGPPAPTLPKNLLLNSSFEEAGLPPWPDAWFLDLAEPGFMVGEPRGSGQDDEMAYHGRVSLRLSNPLDTPSPLARGRYVHEFASVSRRGGIPVVAGKPYTFSAYMRADRDGVPARIGLLNFVNNSPRGSEGVHATFELTRVWRRYEVPVTFPAAGWQVVDRPWLRLWIRNGGSRCTVWVDAIQLEAGAEATPYEPAACRVGGTE